MDYNLNNWSDLLPSAEFAYNNQVYKDIKKSLFFLEYGRHPKAGSILVKELLQRDLNDLIYTWQEALEQTKTALTLAAERIKWYYNQKVQSVPFKVDNKVSLNLKDYRTMEWVLQPWYKGPFEIIEKLSLVIFQLRILSCYQALHPILYASKLAQYSESTICGQKSTPTPPVLTQGQEEWEVEKILDSQQRYGKNKFLVRWKEYSQGDDTWEPEENLHNASEKLQKYLQSLPKTK